jgi:hypothetical protein
MSANFQIHVTTEPAEMLQNPPPQFAHRRLMYCPICVQVGAKSFPASVWCDAAGVLLLRWTEEIWKMSAGEGRAARIIFFDTPCEIWVRRTTTRWWKVSCVVRQGKVKLIGPEILCLPEQIEAALLQAAQKLLAGARGAGVWSDDCAALEAFLQDQAASPVEL